MSWSTSVSLFSSRMTSAVADHCIVTRLYAVYVDCQFTYLEINPLVVIPNEDATSASVHFLDLAAKLDQTADFECGVKWAIARSPAALGITAPTSSNGTVN